MSDSVREPIQRRSIETKQKIVEAGYRLFSEVGYYLTNTAQIAKEAGVSTGIVYGYFKDKRDILLDVLDIYLEKTFSPIRSLLSRLSSPLSPEDVIPEIVDGTIRLHCANAKIHEALHAMCASDEEVNRKFIEAEDRLTAQIAQRLDELDAAPDRVLEKVHFAIGIVQSFSHESVYDKHAYIDYDAMHSIVCQTLVDLLRK